MRSFLLGAISTALAGLLLYIGERAVDNLSGDSATIAVGFFQPTAIVDSVDARGWFSPKIATGALPGRPANATPAIPANIVQRPAIRLTLVDVTNIGEIQVESLDMKIVSVLDGKEVDGIIDVYGLEAPGDDLDNAKMIVSDGALKLHYGLINPKESHVMWVAHEYDVGLEVRARVKGVDVKTYGVDTLTKYWENDNFGLAAIIVLILVSFSLGFIAALLLALWRLEKVKRNFPRLFANRGKNGGSNA